MFDSDLFIKAKTDVTWQLTAALGWTGTKGDTFEVPAGFVTDLATVPRFLHWLTLPYGAYTRAAVLHDWLITSEIPAKRVTSRDADGIFRRVMQDLGVPWAKRWVMWAAVRAASLFSPHRAYGRDFHKDAPKVLGMLILSAPIILPGVVGVLLSLALVRMVTTFRR